MDEAPLYDELTGLLRKAGVEIRTEHFKTPPESAGGLCRMQGQRLVLLHSGASKPERARALLEVVEQVGLANLGLHGHELSPPLLARLSRRGQMPWPHRKDAPDVAKPAASSSPSLKLVHSTPSLSHRTTLGVGGPATHFRTAHTEQDVIDAARSAQARGDRLYPLGGGSNVVVSDKGVDGTVLAIAIDGISFEERDQVVRVTAGAGVNWHRFAERMTRRGYAGVECLGGIPGAVGATPIQNVGAYGQEVSQTISGVRVVDRETFRVVELSHAECDFRYRSSAFKKQYKDRFVVVSVSFDLTVGGSPTVRYGELSKALEQRGNLEPSLDEVFDTVVRLRRAKSMVLDPQDENCRSCGSFFVNAQVSVEQVAKIAEAAGCPVPQFPGEGSLVKIPSAWLIERAGLGRGTSHGPVGLSTKHTLAIVAHDGATANDVVRFASFVRSQVQEKFQVQLTPEPHFWGFSSVNGGLPVDE